MKAIDSSSLAKYVNREENWEEVGNALGEGCVSLELSIKEVGNSLWKRVRSKELVMKEAARFFGEFVESRPFALAEQAELYEPAFSIATEADLTLYDAMFVALAQAREVSLITSDVVQATAAERLNVDVELIR